jgi:hypothetical protein
MPVEETVRQARHESKIRYEPELYEAMREYGHKHRMSFQQIVEEALRFHLEKERGEDAPAETRGLAATVRDEIDAILRAPQSSGRRLRALREHLERFLDGQTPAPEAASDPVLEYVDRIQREPRTPEEEALALTLRMLAQSR